MGCDEEAETYGRGRTVAVTEATGIPGQADCGGKSGPALDVLIDP